MDRIQGQLEKHGPLEAPSSKSFCQVLGPFYKTALTKYNTLQGSFDLCCADVTALVSFFGLAPDTPPNDVFKYITAFVKGWKATSTKIAVDAKRAEEVMRRRRQSLEKQWALEKKQKESAEAAEQPLLTSAYELLNRCLHCSGNSKKIRIATMLIPVAHVNDRIGVLLADGRRRL